MTAPYQMTFDNSYSHIKILLLCFSHTVKLLSYQFQIVRRINLQAYYNCKQQITHEICCRFPIQNILIDLINSVSI